MPAHSVLKSREYREIIGFLTGTIDQSFLREKALHHEAAGQWTPSQTSELSELRERRDAAYLVLERVLEIVLKELTSAEDDGTVDAMPSAALKSLTQTVFPEDDRCISLKREFLSRFEAA